MAVVLRFVDKSGQVKERLLGCSTHGLSISSLRGQGYDGASNMSGEFNGLKALILRENPCTMYIHCFAHQLQLAVVSVAHRYVMLSDLFNMLAIIVNLRLNIEELSGGTGQFQEMSLARLGDTRWGSHLKTVTRFISMLNAIIDVLENISEVDDLSQALQKKDQDIQNAIRLLKLCKYALQNMRDNGWDTLLSKVIQFCVDRHISVPNMDDIIVSKGRPSPRDSFAAFDVCNLVRLAQLYPMDFSSEELLLLRPQLDKFLMLVRMDEAFFNLKSISCVAQKLVETGSSCNFPLVYRLITLVLILPVATASVERVFSAMNLIKNDLRNKMGDEMLNGNLVVYMERDLFMKLENETILQRFQNMQPRRIQLSKLAISE
ncbi:uncharacterized protein LOC111383182 [Olea europaea var. sylvestris]|uniref:uncharacterized protein LOC111383182 n=1 Tax=Olea europaea var. sylvestris TaxID=158386 RepID=UPI000C1D7303|nr:uncharacterized protein LOC111383182 [Olea europaea var. sylvestris]